LSQLSSASLSGLTGSETSLSSGNILLLPSSGLGERLQGSDGHE
jgi:hypothetical protein